MSEQTSDQMTDEERPPDPREATYFAGYVAIPDTDEDFRSASRIGMDTLSRLED